MKKKWIVGTRGSKLALRQTAIVVDELQRVFGDRSFSVKVIKTTGDTVWDRPLHLIGDKGLFVKEIEEALIAKDIDLAVHSVKDLPTELDDRLVLGAVLKREPPMDVFISDTFGSIADLPDNARVGTGSLRRKAQLLHFKRSLRIVPIRGNVDTRIRKLISDNLDGIVLAYAGVKRMGFEARIRQTIPLTLMVPPSGQGAIGVETRRDCESMDLVARINDDASFQEIAIERSIQAMIGGGCQVPLGINAAVSASGVEVHIAYGTEDGVMLFKGSRTFTLPESPAVAADLARTVRTRMAGGPRGEG